MKAKSTILISMILAVLFLIPAVNASDIKVGATGSNYEVHVLGGYYQHTDGINGTPHQIYMNSADVSLKVVADDNIEKCTIQVTSKRGGMVAREVANGDSIALSELTNNVVDGAHSVEYYAITKFGDILPWKSFVVFPNGEASDTKSGLDAYGLKVDTKAPSITDFKLSGSMTSKKISLIARDSTAGILSLSWYINGEWVTDTTPDQLASKEQKFTMTLTGADAASFSSVKVIVKDYAGHSSEDDDPSESVIKPVAHPLFQMFLERIANRFPILAKLF